MVRESQPLEHTPMILSQPFQANRLVTARLAIVVACSLSTAPALAQAQGDATQVQPPVVQTDLAQPQLPTLGQASSQGADAVAPLATSPEGSGIVQSAVDRSQRILRNGGPAIWAIAALSIVTLALILWKIWRLTLVGAWSRGRAGKAVAAYEAGQVDVALAIVQDRRALRSKVVSAAIRARQDRPDDLAREETARVARNELADVSVGLRALELIATIAPLLGLLGTVLGMIAAFQALQESGSRADPALLAGGIWEALLTTAAGMAVAIPASAALSWFESVIDRLRRDMEDAASRIFVADLPGGTDARENAPLAAVSGG
jgi:biopolymer transport protein ExbB